MKSNQWSSNGGRNPLSRFLIALNIVSLAMLTAQATSIGQSRSGDSNAGPVRLARFSYVTGDVNWRRSPSDKWSDATVNLPIRQGAQVWAPEHCRAEIQFDDGSRLWLGSNALITLQTLYSDSDGEFTEITLSDGPVSMKLSNPHSVYQINSPTCSVEATGPARIRCSAEDHTKIELFQGQASVEGTPGKATLRSGDYLDLRDPNSPYEIRPLPQPDAFDSWVSDRNRRVDGYRTRHAHRALPSNLALVGDDLDDYGSWRRDSRYGEVWCPRVSDSDWRPYRHGHWVWVDPYGWTWVADEPWGWAPYHYGSWVHLSFGWGWCPGPRYQYWSPARVAYTDYGGSVGWCPIAPTEVVYPSTLSIGFGGGDWSVFFSIGRAAVYYPTYGSRFIADPWPVSYCNSGYYGGGQTIVNNTTIVRNVTINNNTFITNSGFVPANARAGGTILADRQAFGGSGNFRLASQQQSLTAFRSGRLVAAPARGQFAVAGPQTIRPTALAMTPTRTFRSTVPIPQTVLNRPVYRAPLKPQIARASLPPANTLPVNRSPQVLTRPGAPAVTNGPRAAGPTAVVPGGRIAPAQPGSQAVRQTGPGALNRAPRIGAAPNGLPTATERAMRARANLGMPSKSANRNVSPSAAPLGANRRTMATGIPGRPMRPGANLAAPTGSNRGAATATIPHGTLSPGTRTAVRPGGGANRTAPNISPAERAKQARERVGMRSGGFRGPASPGRQTVAGPSPTHGRPRATATATRTQVGPGRPQEARRTAGPRETPVPRVSHGGGQASHSVAPRRTVREAPAPRAPYGGQSNRRTTATSRPQATDHRTQPSRPEMRAYRRTRESPSAPPRSVDRREYRPAPRSMPSRPSSMGVPQPRSRPESPRTMGSPASEKRGGGGPGGGHSGNEKKGQKERG